VTEVLFYHLEHQPLERVLPVLLERTLERGWRAVVQCGSAERLDALDSGLWTYRDDSFLPHGMAEDGPGELQPIYLTASSTAPSRSASRGTIESSICSMAATRPRSNRRAPTGNGHGVPVSRSPIGSRRQAAAGRSGPELTRTPVALPMSAPKTVEYAHGSTAVRVKSRHRDDAPVARGTLARYIMMMSPDLVGLPQWRAKAEWQRSRGFSGVVMADAGLA